MHKELCDDFKVKIAKLKELFGILVDKKINRDNIYDLKVIMNAMEHIIYEFSYAFLKMEYLKWYNHFTGLEGKNLEEVVRDQIFVDAENRQAIFQGHLCIEDDVKYLPRHFKIEVNLDISSNKSFVIPDDLIVTGDVDLLIGTIDRTVLEKLKELKSKGQIGGQIRL